MYISDTHPESVFHMPTLCRDTIYFPLIGVTFSYRIKKRKKECKSTQLKFTENKLLNRALLFGVSFTKCNDMKSQCCRDCYLVFISRKQ